MLQYSNNSSLEPSMSIAIFGSINMDLVVRAARIPAPGETILGTDFVTVPGGKGANQAVAVAQLGGGAHLLGAVGDDGFGHQLCDSLAGYGVNIAHVRRIPGASGVALITVDDRGENSIVVASGANMRMQHEILDSVAHVLAGCTHILLQLEIPLELVTATLQLARRYGVTTILDPAPAPRMILPSELYQHTDIITPNEHETYQLTDIMPDSDERTQAAANILHARGATHVIIKRGAHGAYWSHAGSALSVPAVPVVVVDTVAAGDCYNGALACALARGEPMPAAMRYAAAAAAIAVTRRGAQHAMPTAAEVDALLR